MRQWCVCVLMGAIGSIATFSFGEAKVEEKVVGPANRQTNFLYTVSPSGLHLGSVAMSGSRFVVIIDGVESPKFDEVYATATTFQDLPDTNGELTQHAPQGAFSVAFSRDGSRYAYAARDAKDVVVICDGKEIFRGPFSPSQARVSLLQFSPDGKHVFFQTPTTDTMYSSCLVMDGQPGPACAEFVWPIFSPDGAHWAYYGKKPTPEQTPFLIVDGKDAGYVAGRLRYTPDSQHLVGVHITPERKSQLLVDGKEMLNADQINRIAISPTGDIAATATVASKNLLYINGKPIDGTEFAFNPIFSPDGKHWAVHCSGGNPVGGWVVVDGKKGQDYGAVSDLVFTGDSSKLIHVAEVQGKKFVIVNGEEQGPTQYILNAPVVGAAGPHYAYVCNNPMARQPVVDGKAFDASPAVDGFVFSNDGTRYAFLQAATDLFGPRVLVVDDKKFDMFVPRGSPVIFSPDSKRYAAVAIPPSQRGDGILIDDKFLPTPVGTGAPRVIGFTPDSQHLAIATTAQPRDAAPTTNYYVDGKLVAQLDAMNIGGLRQGLSEIAPDGTIIVMGTSGGTEVKRFVITPSSDTSIEAWITDVKTAQDEAVAAAEKKAAEDKAAAEQAAADKKAAYEQALADRKAAAEKKAADKKAAQEKAAADKAAKKAGKAPSN